MPSTIRDDFINRLGEDVGDEFYRLFSYWFKAEVECQEYGKLFEDTGNEELLNAVGSRFFGNIKLMMQDNLILHLTRLTDKPGFGEHKNLSLQRLPESLKEIQEKSNSEKIHPPNWYRDPAWLDGLDKLLNKAENKAKSVRKNRDKRIAHLDYKAIMKPQCEPLDGFNFKEVKQILDSIYQVIRYVFSRMQSNPNSDLSNMIGYNYPPASLTFLGGLDSRVQFLVHLDSLIDPEMKLDPDSNDPANSFYKGIGIDLSKLDIETYTECLIRFRLFRIQARELREKGVSTPSSGLF